VVLVIQTLIIPIFLRWLSGRPRHLQSTSILVGLDRWVDTQSEDPMLAISLGSVLPSDACRCKAFWLGTSAWVDWLFLKGSLANQSVRSFQSHLKRIQSLMAAAATSMRNLFSASTNVQPGFKGTCSSMPQICLQPMAETLAEIAIWPNSSMLLPS
jgi:hypothetical protein